MGLCLGMWHVSVSCVGALRVSLYLCLREHECECEHESEQCERECV